MIGRQPLQGVEQGPTGRPAGTGGGGEGPALLSCRQGKPGLPRKTAAKQLPGSSTRPTSRRRFQKAGSSAGSKF